MAIDAQALRKRMLEEFAYKESLVDATLKKIFAMDARILEAFETWLNTGVFPEQPVYQGVSPRLLNETYRMKPPAIFMLLDWIHRDPRQALQALYHEYKKLPSSKKDEG